ncbi:MAG: hypothetical protein ACD_58C00177G0005 [uncultured bacterium]|nr:MAG: hypothetical protein ACD_58C00177G0005 [uncultured bacterium]
MINKHQLFIFTIVLVLMDQFLKWLMFNRFSTYITSNKGTIFGWVNNQVIGYWLLVIGIISMIWIVFNSDLKKPIYRWSIMLIIAGAISNIIDRVWHGFVIDFFSFFNLNHFNLADLYLFVGIVLYLWTSFRKK